MRRRDSCQVDAGLAQSCKQAGLPTDADGAPSSEDENHIHGLGKLRYVVEQTFALLHQFERVTSS